MKLARACFLMMIGVMSITFIPALYIHMTRYVIPMHQVRSSLSSVNYPTGWKSTDEIRKDGYGNCKDYSLLLMEKLYPMETQMLITQRPDEATHAAVLINGVVLDPAFRKVQMYNKYMRSRTLIKKVEYRNMNSYVGKRVL